MRRAMVLGVAAIVSLATLGFGADPAPPPDKFVTREEYDKLLKEVQSMRAEMATMRQERAAPGAVVPPTASSAEVDQALNDMDKQIRDIRNQMAYGLPGKTNIYIGGDAAVDFVAQRGSPSTFEASFAPLLLWKLSDRMIFEGGLDIGIATDDTGESSTEVDLTLANLSYIVNDYITVGGGLFVVPFATFHSYYDPPWINKLPDEPLPFGDNGIAPSSEVGIFIRGGFPAAGMRFKYAIYATNGPQLIQKDPDAAGSLNFDDFTDLNNDKAYGGRFAILPIRELEVGYSIMCASVNAEGEHNARALLQAVDFAYKREVDWLGGTIDFKAEWVWSDVTDITYDPSGKLGFGPLRYDNDRNGGYVQISYRPTMSSNKIIRSLEPVFRYDRLDLPNHAPGGGWDQRFTLGLDYWVQPNVVLKIAYQWDDRQHGEDLDAFMMELGIGL